MPSPLLERCHEVGTRAAARAAEIEAARRLPDDLAADLVATGLFRGWVPAAYGGDELDVMAVFDAIEELAYHDGSLGWSGMIGNTTSLMSARLPAEWAEKIYRDPATVTCGYAMPVGRARAVEGGLVVTGHWQWGSFSHHSTWIGGGCLVVDADGSPAPRADGLVAPFVFFSPDQVELLDTWRVAGLKGTGSTDYRVEEAFVPEGRWAQMFDAPVVDGALYRFPLLGALALGVAAVALGLARRANDEFLELAGSKRPAQSNRTLAERPVVQAQVARAEAARRSARAFVADVVGEAWAAAAAGHDLTGEHRRSLRLAATHATEQAATAVDLMYTAGGGSSIHEASPLQRVFRDVHVATQHGMVSERMHETTGRMALGLPVDVGLL